MRKAIWVAIAVSILGSTGALADTTPQAAASASTTPADNPASPASLAEGKHNSCAAKYYPTLAIRLNHEGSTVLAVHIDSIGNVSGAEVTGSSGFSDLDQAAIDCVTKEWHFKPATMNGEPVASTKQYRVVWKLYDTSSGPWLGKDQIGICSSVFASAKARWSAYHAATLQFLVSPTGAVERPFLAVSSGDELFDLRATECMAKLHYNPAQFDGAPLEFPWTAAIIWSPHTGLAFADGRDRGFYCPDSDFPASMWKGDPSGPTEISFQTQPVRFGGNFAIEKSSGNPELDQAALACLRNATQPFPTDSGGPMDYGAMVRFNWRDGHAFILYLRGN